MRCTSLCAFCCVSHNFAFGGRSVTLLMVHGTMSRLMFGMTKATQPPRKMRERMRQRCVLGVVKGAPPSQFMVSARRVIVLNVLTFTSVGMILVVRHRKSDMHGC